jgi:hypothetical protein
MRDKRRLRRRVPTSYAEFLADFFNGIRQERSSGACSRTDLGAAWLAPFSPDLYRRCKFPDTSG